MDAERPTNLEDDILKRAEIFDRNKESEMLITSSSQVYYISRIIST